MTIRNCLICALACLPVLAGCPSQQQPPAGGGVQSPPWPVSDVSDVILEVNPPVPLNLDDRPGPDGVRVRVYFVGQGDLPVTVTGSVDMLLYELDFPRSREEAMSAGPFKTWTFAPGDMTRAMGRTIIGWGYEFPLLWGSKVPSSTKIILRARYRSPSGQVAMSAPVTIEMTSK